MGGAGLKCALVEVIGAVNVCTALKVDIEADAAGMVLIVEKDDDDDMVAELSILRLLGLVSGSGVGVLVGVTSNWTAFRTLGGPLA
jgi:hypothetical protein